MSEIVLSQHKRTRRIHRRIRRLDKAQYAIAVQDIDRTQIVHGDSGWLTKTRRARQRIAIVAVGAHVRREIGARGSLT